MADELYILFKFMDECIFSSQHYSFLFPKNNKHQKQQGPW